MLENLSTKLQKIIRDLKGEGRISERNVEKSMREIRLALLEADVHFKVVKEFLVQVKEKTLGQEVVRSLTPGQHIVTIVHDELVKLFGPEVRDLTYAKEPPSVILMVGLQGGGKTTSTGKLALWLKKKGQRPLMVSTDVYRPAAIEQLAIIGQAIDVPVFEDKSVGDPGELAREAGRYARKSVSDVLLIDTAGRLHVDVKLMRELERIQATVHPHEILLVADAMTGQDAVNSALQFNQRLDLSGILLTKMDGDARGGAALSIKSVTGKAIKFIGVGEKYEALELFHADRMARRILGMGDVLSIIEKVEEVVDKENTRQMLEKIQCDEFTLEHFRDQLRQVRRLGPLEQVLELLPQMGPFKGFNKLKIDDRKLSHAEGIINSMTPSERSHYKTINGSRRRRIALGSGRHVSEVNRLLKQYQQARKMMRQISKGFSGKRLRKLNFPI